MIGPLLLRSPEKEASSVGDPPPISCSTTLKGNFGMLFIPVLLSDCARLTLFSFYLLISFQYKVDPWFLGLVD